MSKPPPDRGDDENRKVGPNPATWTQGHMPLNSVRGGSKCTPAQPGQVGNEGGHVVKGSGGPAACMPSGDTFRWRKAGKPPEKARHSTHFLQHRRPGE